MNDAEREFWREVRRGLLTVVAAIEQRWNFPRTTGPTKAIHTLGQPSPASPESDPATRSTEPPR